jgi:surface protein
MNCLPVLFARASLKLNSESTKKELEKELVLVNQIQGKLGGLKVTDTAATGLKAEQKDTQAAPAAEPAAAAAGGAGNGKEKAEKEAEAERLAEELEEKRIAEQQAAAEVAAAAAKAKANQKKPVPNGDGSCPSGPWDWPQVTRIGLGKLIDDWIAGDHKKKEVVAEYGTIENWNTKFVTNLKCAFKNAYSFNADISKWDVSNVTTLEQSKSCLEISDSGGPLLFYFIHFTTDPFFFLLTNTTAFKNAAAFNADISQWVVSRVTNMEGSKSFIANC